ncbi:MAG: hypothetical protein JSW39_05300 [Desulfobacterales bacterium]|nr:MAG: hypothetical protein JSW39_05300 [Desulfobacterales bacterium]
MHDADLKRFAPGLALAGPLLAGPHPGPPTIDAGPVEVVAAGASYRIVAINFLGVAGVC